MRIKMDWSLTFIDTNWYKRDEFNSFLGHFNLSEKENGPMVQSSMWSDLYKHKISNIFNYC